MSRFKSLLICLILVTVYTNSASAFSCLQCNSKNSEACLQNPTLLEEDNPCTGDTCYTFIQDDFVIRGCTKPEKGCDEDKGCKSCTGDKCNNKIFPEDRRKCYVCSGSDCETITAKDLQFCKKYKADDQCYLDVESDKKMKRGCVFDDAFEKCTSEICCSTNECNNKNAIETVQCHACDSAVNSNTGCKRPASVPEGECAIQDAGKCDEKVLFGKKPQCYTYYSDNDSVKRGCSDSKPDVPEGNDLIVCNEKMCNDKCTVDTDCYICDSTINADCKVLDKLEQFKKECSPYIGSCFQCENLDGTQVTRGCGTKNDKELVCTNCRDAKKCNSKKLPRSCYVCDSTTDPKCATSPEKTEFCAEGINECMVSLSDKGATIRSCKTAAGCKTGDTTCETCDKHNCNSKNLLDNNLSCYTCDGGGDCLESQKPEKLNKCTHVLGNDKCYMYSADGSTMKRGCFSDDNVPAQCTSNDEKCFLCEDDGCNSRAHSSPANLKCIQCLASDEKCAWRYDRKSATACESKIEYYKSDSCYVFTTADGNVTRGCSSDNTCTSESQQCRRCYTDGCNTESSKSWSCIRCRSDNDGEAKCKSDGDVLANITKTPCTNVPTFDTKGCYTENWYGVAIRGCLADLDPFDFANCKKTEYKWCKSCDDRDCNTGVVPSSSTNLHGSVFFITTYFIVFINFLI